MRNIQHDFEQFMKQREKAASAYVNGDPSPIGDLATRDLPATFFGPGGGTVKGAHEVAGTYEHDSGMFRSGARAGWRFCKWRPPTALPIGLAFNTPR